jgi:hypothetical protein
VEWVLSGEDECSAGQPLPREGESFLERYGYRWDSGQVRLRERRLEEGGPVYVLGVVAPCAEVVRALAGLQDSVVAAAVSAVSHLRESGRHPGEPRDLAAYLRARFGPEERLVWCERRALVISNRAPAIVAQRLRWTAGACDAAGAVLLILAVALFLVAR